jgi:hypothetical protein
VVGGASKPCFVANTPEEGLPLAAILRAGIGMMPAFQYSEITELIITKAQSRIATSTHWNARSRANKCNTALQAHGSNR